MTTMSAVASATQNKFKKSTIETETRRETDLRLSSISNLDPYSQIKSVISRSRRY